ncbi:hypothetical protein P7K49_034234, partial [Saguinus oedipus]
KFEHTRDHYRAPSGNKMDGDLRNLINKCHGRRGSAPPARRGMSGVSATAVKASTSKEPRGL